MSDAKHTPGPWTVQYWNTWEIGPESRNVCQVIESSEKGKPDAHLIAAAPEMLEALERVIAGFEIIHDGPVTRIVPRNLPEVMQFVARAVAKAKGGV